MKRSLITALFIGAVAGSLSPATAQVPQFPFCIQGANNPGWSGCTFSTLQECQATASGTDAECLSNPWYRADGSSATTGTGSAAPYGAPTGRNDPLPVGPPPR